MPRHISLVNLPEQSVRYPSVDHQVCGKLGLNSEEPLELVFRSEFCLFLLVYARDIVNYILEMAGTSYQW